MKNLWPGSFEEVNIQTPKEILEQQAKFLPKLTGDLVHALVEEMESFKAIQHTLKNYPFNYQFNIQGKFLENYSYRVFIVSYDIMIYPLTIYLDADISTEIDLTLLGNPFEVQNEEEFLDYLTRIFTTKKINNVVGTLMRLSK